MKHSGGSAEVNVIQPWMTTTRTGNTEELKMDLPDLMKTLWVHSDSSYEINALDLCTRSATDLDLFIKELIPANFYEPAHQLAWNAICQLHSKGEKVTKESLKTILLTVPQDVWDDTLNASPEYHGRNLTPEAFVMDLDEWGDAAEGEAEFDVRVLDSHLSDRLNKMVIDDPTFEP